MSHGNSASVFCCALVNFNQQEILGARSCWSSWNLDQDLRNTYSSNVWRNTTIETTNATSAANPEIVLWGFTPRSHPNAKLLFFNAKPLIAQMTKFICWTLEQSGFCCRFVHFALAEKLPENTESCQTFNICFCKLDFAARIDLCLPHQCSRWLMPQPKWVSNSIFEGCARWKQNKHFWPSPNCKLEKFPHNKRFRDEHKHKTRVFLLAYSSGNPSLCLRRKHVRCNSISSAQRSIRIFTLHEIMVFRIKVVPVTFPMNTLPVPNKSQMSNLCVHHKWGKRRTILSFCTEWIRMLLGMETADACGQCWDGIGHLSL